MSKRKIVPVFVSYPMEPIKREYESSLLRHLLDNVWGDRCDAEEDVTLIECEDESLCGLDQVRYQFGDTYQASEYQDDIRKLVSMHVGLWAYMNGGYTKVGI